VINEWQPAVLLPLSHMCEFHRKQWDLHKTPEMESTREEWTKKIVFIRVGDEVATLTHAIVPEGECQPLEVKDSLGQIASCFSCEVATD
jgi:hypothetical protein